MQLTLPADLAKSVEACIIDTFCRKFIQDLHPFFRSFFDAVCRMFIYPMLKLIDDRDPWEDRDGSFELVFFCTREISSIVKKSFPMIHAEKFHRHTRDLCNFHRVLLESAQFQF